MLLTYIRSIYITDQSKFIENFKYGKQIDEFLDMPKRPKTSTGPKTHVLGLEYENSVNQIPIFGKFEKYEKDAHKKKKTMQNGSSTFASELMRFRNEAKPIWVEIQKHCKNGVTIYMGLQLLKLK